MRHEVIFLDSPGIKQVDLDAVDVGLAGVALRRHRHLIARFSAQFVSACHDEFEAAAYFHGDRVAFKAHEVLIKVTPVSLIPMRLPPFKLAYDLYLNLL